MINFLGNIIFVVILFYFYYAITPPKKWILLLVASLGFYLFWQGIWLIILLLVSLFSFGFAFFLEGSNEKDTRRKTIFICGLVLTVLPLFFIKYFQFFTHSVLDINKSELLFMKNGFFGLMAPMGISFFTFKALSYLIEVYNRRIVVEKNFGKYSTYVAFFPEVSAGPISKPRLVLSQLEKKEVFNHSMVVKGLRMILMGLLMKFVIADRLGIYVDNVYNNVSNHHGLALLLATFFFSFQIYCDFAGYSLIAIGTAKLFGIKIDKNFDYPYFATSISDFWSRWHISLSVWLRDYLFLPVSYALLGKMKSDRLLGIKPEILSYSGAVLITMFICGLWHGASWTFIMWGMIHGIFLVFSLATKKLRKYTRKKMGVRKKSPVHQGLSILFTFGLVTFAWIFFKASSISQAFLVIKKIFTETHFQRQQGLLGGLPYHEFLITLTILVLFIITEFLLRFYYLRPLGQWSRRMRWLVYYTFVFILFIFGKFDGEPFIYYRF